MATIRQLAAAAEGDPARRQEAIDAICAFLRGTATGDARRDALDLLTGHLRAPWPDVDVDLSGTTLVDADFSGCELAEGRFADTRFVGTTSFAGVRFAGEAHFARTVFEDEARFDNARFEGEAGFGRARFRGPARFDGAVFGSIAWFGRGEDTLWDDDPAWEEIEERTPLPWDEPNEADPRWPIAVLIEDYQEWGEGGDGARFAGPASFRGVRFTGPAWFYKARFGAAADFGEAVFDDWACLEQPAVSLRDARWSGRDERGRTSWPLGWRAEPGSGLLVPDEDVRPYARELASPEPATRRTGLRALAELGDARPELRQRVVDAICGFLRTPLPFQVAGDLDPEQVEEVAVRGEAQRLLADRLRPGAEPHWPGIDLVLSGATLVDLDLSACHADYVDFTGAQFHGTTSFADAVFDRVHFELDYKAGCATFHGPVTHSAATAPR